MGRVPGGPGARRRLSRARRVGRRFADRGRREVAVRWLERPRIPRWLTPAGARDRAAATEAERSVAGGADPKISVIVATYCSGDGLDRLMNSLLSQDLPQQDLELIFVDDGSPDDTFGRVQELERKHANVRAFGIPNSGWPSRPRNVGIENARGEYLFFMDHDDTVYPDGLRRAYDYARETDADLVSPKESKTNDIWWGMPSWHSGNLPRLGDGEVFCLLPLVPHKLYRRSVVLRHHLRFPEGSRVLWEDQVFNVDAFRHSRVVSVLADTSVYLWHGSDTNSSHTFHPSREDFWQRLEQLLDHTRRTLRGRHEPAATALLRGHLQVRVIDRMVRLLATDDGPESEAALRSARRLLRRFGSARVVAGLPRKHRIQAALLRKGRRDLLVAMLQQDLCGTSTSRATEAVWRDGQLRVSIETSFGPVQREQPILRRDGARVLLALPDAIAAEVDPALLDVTECGGDLEALPVLRGRRDFLTWPVESRSEPSEFVDGPQGLSVRKVTHLTIDPRVAGGGRPLADDVFDLHVETAWIGMIRRGRVLYGGRPLPAVVDGRSAAGYANNAKGLSLDLGGTLRSIFSDAVPQTGAAGTIDDLRVLLTRLAADEPGSFGAGDLALVADEQDERAAAGAGRPQEADLRPLALDLEVSDGAGWLTGRVDAPGGTYRILARRGGKWHGTRHVLVVGADRSLEWLTR